MTSANLVGEKQRKTAIFGEFGVGFNIFVHTFLRECYSAMLGLYDIGLFNVFFLKT